MLLHQRDLTATSVCLQEAPSVHVGTAATLPPHHGWRLTSLQVIGHSRAEAPWESRESRPATETGHAAHRAKGASPTATRQE